MNDKSELYPDEATLDFLESETAIPVKAMKLLAGMDLCQFPSSPLTTSVNQIIQGQIGINNTSEYMRRTMRQVMKEEITAILQESITRECERLIKAREVSEIDLLRERIKSFELSQV